MTGGGFVDDPWKTSFGFVVRADGPDGQIQFQLHSGSDGFHASALTVLSVNANQATWTALGAWNGTDGYRLTVRVEDVGPPKKAVRDWISIVIEAPDGSIVFTTTGRLLGGNVVIH